MPLNIAIDGPASSGKGTVARTVARKLGYRYVDTGAMYRTVALMAREGGVPLQDGPELGALTDALEFDFAWEDDVVRVLVDGRDVTRLIRSDAIGTDASLVSRHPEVRAALLDRQRALAGQGGVVMDGRDIGTVVLPGAQLKVYLDASLEERARRRHDELLRRGETYAFAEVLDALEARDHQDMNRAIAPLKQAEDAEVVDTTELSVRQAVAQVMALATAKGAEPVA